MGFISITTNVRDDFPAEPFTHVYRWDEIYDGCFVIYSHWNYSLNLGNKQINSRVILSKIIDTFLSKNMNKLAQVGCILREILAFILKIGKNLPGCEGDPRNIRHNKEYTIKLGDNIFIPQASPL